MYRVLAGLGLCVLAVLALLVVIVFSSADYLLVVFGDPSCPACASLKSFLESRHMNYVFCPIYRNSSCTFGMSVLVNTYGLPPYIPITLVVSNGTLKAVVIGAVRDEGFWLSLTKLPSRDYVPIYMGEEFRGRINVSPNELLLQVVPAELLKVSGRSGAHVTSSGLGGFLIIATLAGLALSDAINPCATYIYVLLLTASVISASGLRRRYSVLGTAAAFISAVYVGYYVIGLGLLKVMGLVPAWVLSLVAIGFGLWVITTGLMSRSRVVAKASVIRLIRKAKTSVVMSLVLGFVVTFTLLPCSSGPYVVFTGLIAKYPLTISAGLLALYNLIFVSPLIAITLLISGVARIKRVQEFLAVHDRELSVIAGTLLILIGIYVIATH